MSVKALLRRPRQFSDDGEITRRSERADARTSARLSARPLPRRRGFPARTKEQPYRRMLQIELFS